MPSLVERARELLADASFPTRRDDLVEHATARGGHEDQDGVLHGLTLLPEGTYSSLDEVLAALEHHDQRASRIDGPTSGHRDVVSPDD